MKRCVCLIALLTACGSDGIVSSDIHVRDADTIVLNGRKGTPVRFEGVDAPELETQEGREGKQWMIDYLQGKSVRCDLTGEMNGDRHIGTCYVDGGNLSAAVIAAGHALDCARYSGGRYRHLETPASKSRLRRAKYCG
ncbi:thermonuclease family protein [Ruegeria conchae]|uniref:Nuclease-like protein n=1 Tax=Ruegeria conchae TaxID=981384 RepID=A0A497ZWP2_9RHOB|nr:thermonuclease family protein [Ruegeria conchae]RLK07427.1 nuclease-like protein [Ruegeria conchae]